MAYYAINPCELNRRGQTAAHPDRPQLRSGSVNPSRGGESVSGAWAGNYTAIALPSGAPSAPLPHPERFLSCVPA